MTSIRDTLRNNLDTLCLEYISTNKISDSELARRMGYSPQKLFKLRRLQLDIRFEDAEKIGDFFNISIAWLCGESALKEPIGPEIEAAIEHLKNASKT